MKWNLEILKSAHDLCPQNSTDHTVRGSAREGGREHVASWPKLQKLIALSAPEMGADRQLTVVERRVCILCLGVFDMHFAYVRNCIATC